MESEDRPGRHRGKREGPPRHPSNTGRGCESQAKLDLKRSSTLIDNEYRRNTFFFELAHQKKICPGQLSKSDLISLCPK